MKPEVLFNQQKNYFPQIIGSSAKQRIRKLDSLLNSILKFRTEIEEALYNDFRKNHTETSLTEIFPAVSELKYVKKKIKRWTKFHKTKTPIYFWGLKSGYKYEPKGNTLIISPWNYPFLLSISPVISAIAAGNTFVLKPSEKSPHTSKALRKIIADSFPFEEGAVIEGGIDVSAKLLELPFNHIFFTGGGSVGRIVMEKAAQNLASVTLELGGKSPAVILPDADLNLTAERVVWGKFVNCGQTCIAPDYIVLPEKFESEFIVKVQDTIRRFYGESIKDKSSSYCRVIDYYHYKREEDLIINARLNGAEIYSAEKSDSDEFFIPPTLLTNLDPNSKILNEEIFGPILPILKYSNEKEMQGILNGNPFPLAMYIFGKDKKKINNLISGNPAGSTAVNETLLQFASPYIPFGGINSSGIGKSHGFFGFEEFSNKRSIVVNKWNFGIKLLYPPYKKRSRRLIDFLIKYF